MRLDFNFLLLCTIEKFIDIRIALFIAFDVDFVWECRGWLTKMPPGAYIFLFLSTAFFDAKYILQLLCDLAQTISYTFRQNRSHGTLTRPKIASSALWVVYYGAFWDKFQKSPKHSRTNFYVSSKKRTFIPLYTYF